MRWRKLHTLIAIDLLIAVGYLPSAHALELKTVEPLQVLSVKVESFRQFPSAFARLAEHCAMQEDIEVVSPQMSLGSGADDLYAAVAFEGSPRTASDVRVLELPAATVAVATHYGPYYFLPWSVKKLVNAVQEAGYTPNQSALLRLLHRNSPDDTAPDDLVTEIQLPVVKQ